MPGTEFLSTPSARRATPCGCTRQMVDSISIHALREEGDSSHPRFAAGAVYFYPRPPRGGRRGGRRGNPLPESISIHALREEGDSACPKSSRSVKMISIHALREEGDPSQSTLMASSANFYPRPPRGGRLEITGVDAWYLNFYPRPPRGGRQQKQRQNLYFQTNYTTFCTNLEEP